MPNTHNGAVMSGSPISRAEMVNWMESAGNGTILEQGGRNWQRVNTVVVEQSTAELDASLADFHLLEIYQSGGHHTDIQTELECGDRFEGSFSAGMLCYAQSKSPIIQAVEGTANIQQIYIDDAVFRDVASGICAGDPDRLRPLGFHAVFDPRLQTLCQTLLREARTGAIGGELYADLLAQQIALKILRRRLGGNEKQAEASALSRGEIARVIDFMEANLEDTGGLEALASSLDMSVFAFTRAFKAATGEAPHQFLIRRRLTRATDLLVRSKMSLAEIAYATGFSSQSHMTATFTRFHGMPPGKYRREAMGMAAPVG